MKRKFIDIRTTKGGEVIDDLCFNHATVEQLMAVLTIATIGFEVLVITGEEEVTMPFKPAPKSE